MLRWKWSAFAGLLLQPARLSKGLHLKAWYTSKNHIATGPQDRVSLIDIFVLTTSFLLGLIKALI
jgi:hypothetical protein